MAMRIPRGLARYATPFIVVAVTTVLVWLGPDILRAEGLSLMYLAAVFIATFLGGSGPGYATVALSLLIANWLFVMPKGGPFTADNFGGEVAFTFVSLALVSMMGRRRRAERALRESEKRFRTAQELSLDAFTVLRAVRGKTGAIVDFEWLYANPAAERTLGHAGLAGKRLLDVLPGNREDEDLFERYANIVESGASQDVELRYEANGISRWFRNMAVKLDDGVAVSLSEITRRKETEEALRDLNQTLEERVAQRTAELVRSQEALKQSERLVAIGQVMAGLSHESRNALQRLLACLDMLAKRVDAQSPLARLVAEARKAQGDLLRAYESVREYARPVELDRGRVDVSEVWRRAWENLPARQNRNAALVEDRNGSSLEWDLDAVQMERVFRNLLDNALSACPDPVEIHVSCSLGDRDGDPILAIRVRDNGPGLTAEQRQHLFDPFYTTKTKGTGLGLSTVKRIVEAHGGRAELGPPLERGLEVVLELPGVTP